MLQCFRTDHEYYEQFKPWQLRKLLNEWGMRASDRKGDCSIAEQAHGKATSVGQKPSYRGPAKVTEQKSYSGRNNGTDQ